MQESRYIEISKSSKLKLVETEISKYWDTEALEFPNPEF